MQLSSLISSLQFSTPTILPEIEITHITDNSRQVQPGSLFVAVRGAGVDGHRYIPQAIEAGAVAIVAENSPDTKVESVCYITVNDSREALGLIASAWYAHPSHDLTVVGVTGTNGKTTIATLLYRLHRLAGYSCSLISTVCNYIDEEAIPSTHTTPGAIALQGLLAQMRDAGCQYVFMEVSSHATEQKRIAGLEFDGAIFTNLTRDHLDYHGTVLEYLRAKKLFFDNLSPTAFALTNLDEKSGMVMLQNCSARKFTYALHSVADYHATILERHVDSTLLQIDGQEVTVRLIGEFNTYNLLAVYGAARLLGMPQAEALALLSKLTSVDGRFETFVSPARGYTTIVDYAHTPDALVNVLSTIRTLSQGKGRIICVVGCGGDRDRGKRPLMASEACRLAHEVILTSDNPRTEDPVSILQEMQAGIAPEDTERVQTVVDRATAIELACQRAHSGDYVLIAGKGHETYQEIQGVRHHFDDREVVRHYMDQEGTTH